ncbi:thiol peroxidase [Marinicella sp. S1101]|uniref:thiol peroxidase n=1 Tax=Marinicella marina TaxID=2996016 RepID=UPI002260CCF6|nr:thiol peroxidase [Marinicella marina]MCX7553044.1 thiol peroxidase [Marinicella marina]MDJ1139596.1 thiol peroxidase [Marinicella marina]
MAQTKFKGNPINTEGDFPKVGSQAPDFQLIKADLSDATLAEFKNKKVIFNIFPSVDTAVCALQLKTFSQKAAALDDVVLLFASMDLPFALNRFCAAEGIENAVTTSDFRHQSLAKNYGVKMTDGPLNGLYARATLVINENGEVVYSELVDDVVNEPDYAAALATL